MSPFGGSCFQVDKETSEKSTFLLLLLPRCSQFKYKLVCFLVSLSELQLNLLVNRDTVYDRLPNCSTVFVPF